MNKSLYTFLEQEYKKVKSKFNVFGIKIVDILHF